MNRWFQKGNARRFYRIDMQIKAFMLPASPISDREIYATGADYYPPSTQRNLAKSKQDTLIWLAKIQEHKETINLIFDEFIEFIEFFGYCVELISEGKSPKKDPEYWLKLAHHREGFSTIHALKERAPRTYQYFKMIEQKYMVFLNSLVHSINHSTPSHFEVDAELPFGFKIDEILERFSNEKFAKIPLIQAIVNLCSFLENYMGIYRQITQDNYLKQFPDEWKTDKVNVSASGISQMLTKRFHTKDKVDVYLYFEQFKRVIHFEASVVDIRSIEGLNKERVALNFDFPNGQDQDFLQSEIEKYEIKECMDLVL